MSDKIKEPNSQAAGEDNSFMNKGEENKNGKESQDESTEQTSRGKVTKFRMTSIIFAIISIMGDILLGLSDAAKKIHEDDPENTFGVMGTEAKEKLRDLTNELVKVTEVANKKMKQFSDEARKAIPAGKTGGADDEVNSDETKTAPSAESGESTIDKARSALKTGENAIQETKEEGEKVLKEGKDVATEAVSKGEEVAGNAVSEGEEMAQIALQKGEELAKEGIQNLIKLYEAGVGYGVKYGSELLGEAGVFEIPFDKLNEDFTNELNTLSTFLNDAATNPQSREAIKELAKALAVTAVTVIDDVKPEVMHVTDNMVHMVENITEKGTRGAAATMISVFQSFVAEIPWVGGVVDLMIAVGKGFNTAAEVFKIFVSKNSTMVVSTAKGVKKTESAVVQGAGRIMNAVNKIKDLMKSALPTASAVPAVPSVPENKPPSSTQSGGEGIGGTSRNRSRKRSRKEKIKMSSSMPVLQSRKRSKKAKSL
jgi:hypothetical protein